MIALYYFIVILERVLTIAIFARIIFSWLPLDRNSSWVMKIYRLLFEVTEPILLPIRRVVPAVGGLDLSPMIALILIQMIRTILLRLVL